MSEDGFSFELSSLSTRTIFKRYDGSPSAAFPSEVTPIVLASHKNSLPLIKVLVDQGRFIPDPGVVLNKDDHAHQNLYRGLVSPYYILLTNDDPLSRAFELSSRLDDVGASKPEVEEVYAEMAEGTRSLGVDLLDQVWNRDEAAAILNGGDEHSPLIHGDDCQMELSKLDMAVDHEQKRFVAHQWSQRLVNECWYGVGKYFTPTTNIAEYLRGFVLMLLTPILALIYLLAPMSVPGRFVRTPAVRFAMYLASVITFIVMVFLRAEKIGYNGPEGGQLAPSGTVLEWLIFVWILGMLLEEGRLMVKNGPLASLTAMGIMTWVIIVIYLAAFFLRVASHVEEVLARLVRRYLLLHAREKNIEPIFADISSDGPVNQSGTSIKVEPDGVPVGESAPSNTKRQQSTEAGNWSKIQVGSDGEEGTASGTGAAC
uniref:Transient receptor ion channel domain-containing protein n=1 Tax=Branchiostoma floridae TaxID=7739 RepID=C3ZV45_BRAFL|eukprot:XP_002587555.1 hypothetical protein BRAFLDRAFT_95697 [Branchiostoma floridae]